jgi:hypothetical protein
MSISQLKDQKQVNILLSIMSSASKRIVVEFNENDLASMLLKVMPDFHNKEPLSQYMAGALMELGDTGHIGGIIKLIAGVNEELSYTEGMNLYMSQYAGISTWDIDKELSIEKANAITIGNIYYYTCKVINVVPNKLKCYYVQYNYVNSGGEIKKGEAWVAEKDLKPQIKI